MPKELPAGSNCDRLIIADRFSGVRTWLFSAPDPLGNLGDRNLDITALKDSQILYPCSHGDNISKSVNQFGQRVGIIPQLSSSIPSTLEVCLRINGLGI